ncbi:unnamed protein product [Rotaria sp. Silwood2]|nr:unnamed protein product [Rotaria sp. Silwood2]
MIFDNFTIIFEQVETETPRTLTAKEDLELKHLALINNCHIVKIETKSKTKICSVPKAITITTISHQSKFITNQSILFSSSASVFYKVSISYASIEIHTMSNRFMDQKVDLTILSSTTDAIKEDIDINKDNSFVETQSGRKFVFVQWNLPSYNDDVQIKSKFKKKIKKFVSTSLQLITSNIKDEHLETIMFSTTEWEKCSNKKEFASEMINEIQHQLETRIGCRWRILFVFSKDEKQTELCQEFLSVMSTKQNEKDGFVAVSVPVTVTEITLSISRNNVWKKCQNALKDYIKQTICITKKLENQVDLKLWSQHMINAFYQYCITKYVILRMSLNNTEQIIELTGHTDTVDEAFDKYRLMTEILKQKVIEVAGSTMQSEPPNTSKTSSRKTTRNESTSSKEYYNIWLSYCKLDKKICSRLKERLIDEGYLVATNTSDDHTVTIKKCDLIILYLSEEYALSNASEMKEAKSSDKKILLIKPTKLACRGKNNWLHSMTTKQLSYELFNGNFTIELDTNNFDQEYDRLLIEISTTPHDKQNEQQPSQIKKRENTQEKVALTAYTSNQDIYRKVEEHPDFVTKIKRGKVAWDITDDRLVKLSTQPYSKLDLEWFTPMKQRVQNTRTIILGSKKRFSICERSWNYYKKKQLETIEEINKSQGNNSDLIQQRRIGDELKKKEEMDKLLKLDDPNRIWRIPENFSQKFFEQKKKNIIEFKQLCVE